MMNRSQIAPMPQERPLATAFARAASLALASLIVLVLLFRPALLMRGDELLTHALLPFLLLGIGACLAHGLGWRPRSSVLAHAAGPLVAWPLSLAVFAFLALGGAA